MALPWLIQCGETARLCAKSKDPLAFSPMQRVSAIAFLHHNEGLNDRAIAALSQMSSSAIRHHLRLSKKLSPELCEWLHGGQLSFGHAKLLAGLAHREQLKVAQKCIDNGWPVKALRKYLAGETSPANSNSLQKYYQQLSENVSEQIGFPVKIAVKGDGPQGKIEIQYFTLDDFDTLCQRLQIQIDQ